MAEEILKRDKAMRGEIAKILDAEGVTGEKNEGVAKKLKELDPAKTDSIDNGKDTEEGKKIIADEEKRRDAIARKAAASAWPVMMRPQVKEEDRVKVLESAIADSVFSSKKFSAEEAEAKKKSIKTAGEKLAVLIGKDNEFGPMKTEEGDLTDNYTAAISSVRKAAGANESGVMAFLDKLKISWGTGGGAAAGAAWALMSEDFSSVGSVAMAALKVGGLAAAGNILWDRDVAGIRGNLTGAPPKKDTGKGGGLLV
jgi:hypothetical protein